MKSNIRSNRRGAALITTLLLVVILSLLIIAVLSISSKQVQSSASQEAIVNLNSMRDSAINIAISQIREATTQDDEHWASQPGAIRTFESDGGAPSQIFKLYSDDEMVEEFTTGNANLESDLVRDWDTKPGVYADLNKPKVDQLDQEEKYYFPIVDPRAFDTGSGPVPEGFSFESSINGAVNSGSANDFRLPMPVKWIYQLRDGTMGTLSDSNIYQPFDGSTNATEENPIAGRFAFWVDDETAKVNINTASEAIPWDTPRCYTKEDLAYAEQQPVLNEVQRFFGHPATTCLSSVFYPNEYLTPDENRRELEELYDFAPRVNYDGGILADNHERVTFDPDRLYASIDDAIYDGQPDSNGERDVFELNNVPLDQRRFFLTANSKAAEVNPDGKPKLSLWPMHWDESNAQQLRTPYDNALQFATTLNEKPYFYQRGQRDRQQGDWTSSGTAGVDDQSGTENQEILEYFTRSIGYDYRSSSSDNGVKIPGYEDNFFSKYGVRNMAYNSFLLFDYARTINLMDDTKIDTDGNGSLDARAEPWAAALQSNRSTHYRIGTANSNLLMRNQLGSAKLSPQIESLVLSFDLVGSGRYGLHTLGRRYSLSEVAMVFVSVIEKTATGFNPPISEFSDAFRSAVQDSNNNLYLGSTGDRLIQVAFLAEFTAPGVGYPHVTPINIFSMHDTHHLEIEDRKPFKISGGQYDEDDVVRSAVIDFGVPTQPVSTDGFLGMWAGSAMGGTADYRLMSSGLNLVNSNRHGAMNDAFYKVTNAEIQSGKMKIKTSDYMDAGLQQGGVTGTSDGQVRGFEIPNYVLIPVPSLASNPEMRGTWDDRLEWFLGDLLTNPEADFIDENDVIRSFANTHGDARVTVSNGHSGWDRDQTAEKENWLDKMPGWDSDENHVHTLFKGGKPIDPTKLKSLISSVDYHPDIRPDMAFTPTESLDTLFTKAIREEATAQRRRGDPYIPYPYPIDPRVTRDWDTGPGNVRDGGYSNIPDYGTHPTPGYTPYFSPEFDYTIPLASNSISGPEITKPNHMMPSAGMFGSLPSLARDLVPWTTFLFRPEMSPSGTSQVGHIGAPGRSRNNTGSHPLGSNSVRSFPPDHMLMEYFWMPVIQPYSISEPFATAGKVAMNYRMAPFTHIKRATGLHAVMKSERMLSIPTDAGPYYKTGTGVVGTNGVASHDSRSDGWRQPIDVEKTLLQWEERFDEGDYFQSASEVCEMFLVPNGAAPSAGNGSDVIKAMRSHWDNHELTGDNVLERPYTNIYPRLTTKSNTYKIHYLVQTLKLARRDGNYNEFDPKRDAVVGEDQGEALIERFIDPNDEQLDDSDYEFLTNENAEKLDNLYQYRIRFVRKFIY